MKMIVTVAATPVTSVRPTLSAVDAPSAPRAVDRLLHALDDVVLGLQEAERAAPVREVADVAGDGVDEVVDLGDERAG